MRASFLILSQIAVLFAANVHAAEFFGIGRDNYDDVQFEKLSGNGTAIVGRLVNHAGRSSEIEPFRWTKKTGIVSLGQLSGATAKGAITTDVSFDGKVVTGFTATNRTRGTAFVWSADSGITAVGAVGPIGRWFDAGLSDDGQTLVVVGSGFLSWNSDIGATEFSLPAGMAQTFGVELSASGSAAVGTGDVGSFYWTAEDGVQLLSELAGNSLRVTNLSIQNRRPFFDDGNGVIGVGDDGTVLQWTGDGGLNELGWISPDLEPQATHVSDDGRVVVGSYEGRSQEDTPWIWTEEQGIWSLELPAGVNTLAPRNMTPDGQTILLSESRFGDSGGASYIWNQEDGLQPLATVLADDYDLGNAIDGWTLTVPWGISDDGSVLAGEGINPRGEPEIWVAILRESIPGDLDSNGLLNAADIDLLSEQVRRTSTDLVFDLNADGVVDEMDRVTWVEDIAGTFFGDANLDGEFSSEDIIAVFQAGKYERDEHAGWAEGDWTGDGRFSSADMVVAFQDGGYELGPRGAATAVPEPSCAVLLGIGLIGLWRMRTCR